MSDSTLSTKGPQLGITNFGAIDGASAYQADAVQRAASTGLQGQAAALNRVGIVGAGAMGRGIAIAFLNAGYDVVLFDSLEEALSSAKTYIDHYFSRQLEKCRIAKNTFSKRMASVRFAKDIQVLAPCDMVIEAVPENMTLKKQIIASLDGVVKQNTILASNTSTLDIDEITSASQNPRRVIGTHFFIPAQITRLLEVVPGEKTSTDVLASVMALADDLGKSPVIAGNCDGFIGNRLFDRFHQEAMFLLEEGALPFQIDDALERWGYVIGPFRALDIVGNDIPWTVRVARKVANPKIIQPSIGDVLCDNGLFGQKCGEGWYSYQDGSRKPAPNPVVRELIEKASANAGIKRRPIEPEEIIERCVLTVINEASSILGEGHAKRGSDIDVVQVNGYGFPAKRGGPLFLADHLGLDNVVAKIKYYRDIAGPGKALWQPHPYLIELAGGGRSIAIRETLK